MPSKLTMWIEELFLLRRQTEKKKKIRQTRKKKIRPPKTQVKVGVKNILHYQLGDHQLQHSTWQK